MTSATLAAVKSEVLAQGAASARLAAVKSEVLYSLLHPPIPSTFSGLTLPSLAGMGWQFHKMPTLSTGTASHVSGRSTRWQNYQYPIWEFQALWNGLTSASPDVTGLGAQSLQSLLGFFLQVYAQADPWLFVDPSDYSVPLSYTQATADGSTTTYSLVRDMGGFLEPVPWVTSISEVQVDGVTQYSSQVSFTQPNTLTFVTAPSDHSPINVAFEFAFIVRCLSDELEFSEFYSQLFELGTFKFRSVRYPF